MTHTIGNIPTADHRAQFALLFAGIAAASQEADAGQKDQLARLLVPRLEKIRNMNKSNRTGDLDTEIAGAREVFTQIMGEHWQPDPNGQVAQALKSKGVDLSIITGGRA